MSVKIDALIIQDTFAVQLVSLTKHSSFNHEFEWLQYIQSENSWQITSFDYLIYQKPSFMLLPCAFFAVYPHTKYFGLKTSRLPSFPLYLKCLRALKYCLLHLSCKGLFLEFLQNQSLQTCHIGLLRFVRANTSERLSTKGPFTEEFRQRSNHTRSFKERA